MLVGFYDPDNFITPLDTSKANELPALISALENSETVATIAGWIVIVCFVRLIKYIASIQMFYQPMLTIMIAWKDIVAFMSFMLLLQFGLAVYGYLVFGDKIRAFSSIRKSFYTLLRGLLGDLDFETLEGTHYLLDGIQFLCIYGFLTSYIILTMFVTIIDSGFGAAKERISNGEYEHHAEVLANGMKKLSHEIQGIKKRLGQLPFRRGTQNGGGQM